MYALVVHGGAGDWKPEIKAAVLEGVGRAARAGIAILAQGGSALDAAVAAVASLEDDPLFNAGTGSALNLDGEAEMDAAVMVGEGLRAGAVACLKRVRNPVQVARKVLEETDHVLLAGEGALRFARALGFPDHDPVTAERLADWRKRREALVRADRGPRLARLLGSDPARGTVGAVALDRQGRLAAATSTGGLPLKLPGRVGDTPVPGAGYYACLHGAVCATGHGELMLRYLTTKAVTDRMVAGASAQQAADDVLRAMAESAGSEVGIIAVDARGGIGVAHATAALPHAWGREGGAITVKLGISAD